MHSEPLDRTQAENLARELCLLDGVAGLDAGRFGEVALIYPGARVRGLHVTAPKNDKDTPHFEVYVVVDGASQPNLKELASRVRNLVESYTPLPVDVVMSDVA